MARINGGEMLIRALVQQGLEQVFALHGGHLEPIFQACLKHEVRVFDTRHEAAAVHMADGWARSTGRPGVAIVTAGPGVTNAVTGLANAYLDAIPLICIGGRSPLRDDDRLPLQGLDQISLVRPVTKYARTVLEPDRIPEYVATAYRHAVSGRPGPVFLDIPADVLFSAVEESRLAHFDHIVPEGRPGASTSGIDTALDILERAERPAIFAGGGVMFSGASKDLRTFAERAQIPVFASAKARGCVSEEHPLGHSALQAIASPEVQEAAGGPADVLLLLGARVGMFTAAGVLGGGTVIPADATLIQVDIEAEEIGRTRDVDLGLVGDVGETLKLFIERSKGRTFRDHSAWVGALSAGRDAARSAPAEAFERTERPIHPARLAREIAAFVDAGATLVADGGDTSVWAARQAVVTEPGHFLSHGYLGCLGVGIPFGLAAALARPGQQVLTLSGDGSMGLNFSELNTAVRHNVPLVVVVNNDQGWGMSRHGQVMAYGEDHRVAVELGPVRYDLAAAGFGAHAEFVQDASEIRPALERAFASGRPACVNVITDPTIAAVHTVTPGKLRRHAYDPAPDDESPDEVDLPYYGKRPARS